MSHENILLKFIYKITFFNIWLIKKYQKISKNIKKYQKMKFKYLC